MRGMSFKDLRKEKYLIPIFVICALDMVGVAFFALRTAKNHPDVSFNRSKTPWEEYRNKQFQFWASDSHKDEYVCQAPIYEEEKAK